MGRNAGLGAVLLFVLLIAAAGVAQLRSGPIDAGDARENGWGASVVRVVSIDPLVLDVVDVRLGDARRAVDIGLVTGRGYPEVVIDGGAELPLGRYASVNIVSYECIHDEPVDCLWIGNAVALAEPPNLTNTDTRNRSGVALSIQVAVHDVTVHRDGEVVVQNRGDTSRPPFTDRLTAMELADVERWADSVAGSAGSGAVVLTDVRDELSRAMFDDPPREVLALVEGAFAHAEFVLKSGAVRPIQEWRWPWPARFVEEFPDELAEGGFYRVDDDPRDRNGIYAVHLTGCADDGSSCRLSTAWVFPGGSLVEWPDDYGINLDEVPPGEEIIVEPLAFSSTPEVVAELTDPFTARFVFDSVFTDRSVYDRPVVEARPAQP